MRTAQNLSPERQHCPSKREKPHFRIHVVITSELQCELHEVVAWDFGGRCEDCYIEPGISEHAIRAVTTWGQTLVVVMFLVMAVWRFAINSASFRKFEGNVLVRKWCLLMIMFKILNAVAVCICQLMGFSSARDTSHVRAMSWTFAATKIQENFGHSVLQLGRH